MTIVVDKEEYVVEHLMDHSVSTPMLIPLNDFVNDRIHNDVIADRTHIAH